MNSPLRPVIQTLGLILVVFLLIRAFPLVVRIGDAAAMGLREFWWGILILVFVGWLVYFFSKRRRR